MVVDPVERYYESQRLKLCFWDWFFISKSSPECPVCICIHTTGDFEQGRVWDSTAKFLLTKGFRVYALDLRGHGNSDWAIGSNYTVFDYIVDLRRFLYMKTLLGLPAKVTLIGHGVGGIICTLFASFYPDEINRVVSVEGVVSPGVVCPNNMDVPLEYVSWVDQVRNFENTPILQFDSQGDLKSYFLSRRKVLNEGYFGSTGLADLSESVLQQLLKSVSLPSAENPGKFELKNDPWTKMNS